MKTVAIVQARMGSTRLPGKVMIDLGGQTVLQRVARRLQRAKLIDEVVVATTTGAADEVIVGECKRLGVDVFRGSEQDVLERYYQAALERKASSVVRITADCPLIDPVLVDETIEIFVGSGADYASNVSPRTYPRGLDVEVMKTSALAQARRDAKEPHQREHVTPYLYEHPELFQLASHSAAANYSRYRWTLDTPEDLALLQMVYSKLHDRNDFGWQEVIAMMEHEPNLAEINAEVRQRTLYPI
jgi:spore coat polysaccharide biosynthesis protein SpsF (cytidylyltransferase family)